MSDRDHITLLGAEDVRAAASTIANAAYTMRNAASSLTYALESHQRFMDNWLQRFEAALAAQAERR